MTPAVLSTTLELPMRIESHGNLDRPIGVQIREAHLVRETPWVRSLGALTMKVSTQGWRFASPVDLHQSIERPSRTDMRKCASHPIAQPPASAKRTSLRPPDDTVQIK